MKDTAALLTADGAMPLASSPDLAQGVVIRLIRDVSIAGLLMGFADYAYQRRRIGRQLKMSLHEVKQEHEQTDGDPPPQRRDRLAGTGCGCSPTYRWPGRFTPPAMDQEIPAEPFAAVAQVLAFALSLEARGSAAGTHKLPQLLGAGR